GSGLLGSRHGALSIPARGLLPRHDAKAMPLLMTDDAPTTPGDSPAPEPVAVPAPPPDEGSERPHDYLADIGFDDLGLSPEVRRAVAERGYAHPTPVQAKAFKPVVEGRDLIVRSKTGTG